MTEDDVYRQKPISILLIAEKVLPCSRRLFLLKMAITVDFTLTYSAVRQGDETNGLTTDHEVSWKVCDCMHEWLQKDDQYEERAVKPVRCLKLYMDPTVFCLTIDQLRRSRSFRANVLKRVFSNPYLCHCRRRLVFQCDYSPGSSAPDDFYWDHFPIRILVNWTRFKVPMDIPWCRRMETLFQERLELQETMAWLSTLGGAFSSLGDQFTVCAVTAGEISVRQMRIAWRLGDSVTVSKCKLFMALSLMQLGHIKQACLIVREQYAFAISLPDGAKDFRLENMCKGIWARLQYLYKNRKSKPLTEPRSFLKSSTMP